MPIESPQPPTRVILEQANPWGRWFARAGWIVAGVAVLSAIGSAGAFSRYFQRDTRVVEKWHSLSKLATDKVAVVSIAGAILGGEGFVRAQLDQAEEDEAVKAIVLRIDSPGGTVSGSDEIHHRIAALAKKRDLPVVVSMGGIAASGGYYVAMANRGGEDVIFAEPATLTGSIGVIIPHFDVSQALRKYDIRDDSIASGPLKEMLSITKDRTPELAEKERKLIQELVDDMFRRFKDIVQEGRPKLDEAGVDRIATGQIFTARQALEAGLVDRIGFLEDAIDRAVELAGLSKETARVVKYTRPKGLLDEVLGGVAPTGRVDLATVAELTTPRGWYLCSWLPALVRSR
jgi:protease-4